MLNNNGGKTVVVAMSGGVDSSVVAAMLRNSGHKVIGVTMQLYDHGQALGRKGACCAGIDIYDAQLVAESLNIPHYVLNFESKFKENVIEEFSESYIKGETPVPCIRCNQSVKFNDLLKLAKDLGGDALATGHYIKKLEGKDGIELHKAVDTEKDQSYFLFATTREQLKYVEFPLGELKKSETREIAAKYGLKIADKADSQDICFVPNGDYRKVINKIKPNSNKVGKIIHVDGYEIGMHDGIINYTIGQRKRLNISNSNNLYVIRIDPDSNVIYVGPEFHLYKKKFIIKEVNWLTDVSCIEDKIFKVKVRSQAKEVNANIKILDKDCAEIILQECERAVTPGQACVIYDDTRLIGGGWITKNIN